MCVSKIKGRIIRGRRGESEGFRLSLARGKASNEKAPIFFFFFSASLARLRKFGGIRGFCAALTKPRLLSPPGQIAAGCLQTGFFTCEPQHAPETNFESGDFPRRSHRRRGAPCPGAALRAGGHPASACGVGGVPDWSIRCWRFAALPVPSSPPGYNGSPCKGGENRPAFCGRVWVGTVESYRYRHKPRPVDGLRESLAEP